MKEVKASNTPGGAGECAERIYGITYHISSSPYYSEDMHTKYTLTLPYYYSKES